MSLGDFDRSTWSDIHSVQIQASAIVYPQYNSSNWNEDIALLKLKTPIDFNSFPHIRPLCLSSSAIPTPGQTVTVVGWSGTGFPCESVSDSPGSLTTWSPGCNNAFRRTSWEWAERSYDEGAQSGGLQCFLLWPPLQQHYLCSASRQGLMQSKDRNG